MTGCFPRSAAVLATLLTLALTPAYAWGPDGHRVVGELAEQALTPAVQAQVRDLLRDEPLASLAGVANWADTIRSEEAWRYTGSWHYLNLPDLQCHYEPKRDCANGNCVVGAIEAQTQVLADLKQPRAKRIEALKFVVHFVGDIHQPLHAGLRADRGGNDFQISYLGEGWNLHSIWDSLILREPIAEAGGWKPWSAQLITDSASPLPSPRGGSARDWAQESCALIGSQALYPGRHKIGKPYLTQHLPIAETRLRQAGARLATILEATLAPLTLPQPHPDGAIMH